MVTPSTSLPIPISVGPADNNDSPRIFTGNQPSAPMDFAHQLDQARAARRPDTPAKQEPIRSAKANDPSRPEATEPTDDEPTVENRDNANDEARSDSSTDDSDAKPGDDSKSKPAPSHASVPVHAVPTLPVLVAVTAQPIAVSKPVVVSPMTAAPSLQATVAAQPTAPVNLLNAGQTVPAPPQLTTTASVSVPAVTVPAVPTSPVASVTVAPTTLQTTATVSTTPVALPTETQPLTSPGVPMDSSAALQQPASGVGIAISPSIASTPTQADTANRAAVSAPAVPTVPVQTSVTQPSKSQAVVSDTPTVVPAGMQAAPAVPTAPVVTTEQAAVKATNPTEPAPVLTPASHQADRPHQTVRTDNTQPVVHAPAAVVKTTVPAHSEAAEKVNTAAADENTPQAVVVSNPAPQTVRQTTDHIERLRLMGTDKAVALKTAAEPVRTLPTNLTETQPRTIRPVNTPTVANAQTRVAEVMNPFATPENVPFNLATTGDDTTPTLNAPTTVSASAISLTGTLRSAAASSEPSVPKETILRDVVPTTNGANLSASAIGAAQARTDSGTDADAQQNARSQTPETDTVDAGPAAINGATEGTFTTATTSATSVRGATPNSPASSAGERAHIVEQVTRHLETLRLTNGRGELSLQLRPDHLGSVRVTLASHADGVVARIVAETAHAQQAIDGAKEHLRAALESKGLRLHSLDVSTGQEGAANSSTAFASQQDTRQERAGRAFGRRFADPAGPNETTETVAPAPRPDVRTIERTSRLDYQA